MDQDLARLIAAVSTALDEYRFLSTTSRHDEVELSGGTERRESVELQKAVEQSSKVEHLLVDAAAEVKEVRNVNSSRADNLLRSINDTTRLATLARAELGMQRIVVRWLRPLADGLRNSPKALRAIGQTIRVGSDVLAIALSRWSEFWSRFETFALEEVGKTGDAVIAIADRLERRQPTPPPRELWEDEDKFGTWLRSYVADLGGNQPPGASYTIVIEAAAELAGKLPNELASSLGQKSMLALVERVRGVRILRGPGGVITLATAPEGELKAYVDERIRVIVKFVEAMLDARGPQSMKQIARQVRGRFRPIDRLTGIGRTAVSLREILLDNPAFERRLSSSKGEEIFLTPRQRRLF